MTGRRDPAVAAMRRPGGQPRLEPDAGPRVLVDPGGYDGANIGDAAMLVALLSRIRRRWPAARIACHAADPAWLRGLDADAVPVDPGGAHAWNLEGAIAARLGVAVRMAGPALVAGRALRQAWPDAGRRLARVARRALGRDPAAVDRYLDEVRRADLIVKAGAGAITDAFAWHAYQALDTVAMGQRAGAVTALVGQGIGPIADRRLRRRAGEVLRGADLVALRDGAASHDLVARLGVPPERVTITGDDALALLAGRPPAASPAGLGVNVRCAVYAGLDAPAVAAIGDVLRAQAARGRHLVALPIERHADVDDLGAIARCVAPLTLDAGGAPRTPGAFVDTVEGCRAVVTGSYHGAVLALGSGVPAVAVTASRYYTHKMTGLAGLFGGSCRIVDARQADFPERLRDAIDAAWDDPASVRTGLRAAAAEQAARGHAAFDRLADRVDARRRSG